MAFRRASARLLMLSSALITLGAQPADVPLEQQARSRIAPWTVRLAQLNRPDLPETPLVDERERATVAIRAEVTRFIEQAISPSDKAEAAQSRLRSALADHIPERGVSDEPTVRVAPLKSGRSMVVNYTVVRPPHNHSSLLFGFREDDGRFQLVATAGEEFEGYGMRTLQLQSAVPGELWLLTWGRAFTFNGAKYRLRVFSFDGEEFRTVWSPDEDFFNADVTPTSSGFSVTRILRETPGWERVTEEYAALAGGIARIK